jgi:MFS family permease
MNAYAIAFAAAALAGLVSSWHLLHAAEPQMHDAGPPATLAAKLGAAFHDRGFRNLLRLLAGWNLASNLAAPFITVYLLQQLHYGLGTVTALWVTSQAANAATLFAWGRVSDKLSNKGVLAVALPLYFLCLLALVFTRVGQPYGAQLPLLFAVHLIMGAAGGGVALSTGNLALKLAPQGQGTSYLAACGLVSAVAGGAAPLVAGTLAEWWQSSQLAFVVRWVSAADVREVSVLRFAHLEILFALAALLGLYALHALTRIAEGEEVSERRVIQEFALEAQRSVNHLSTLGGVLGSLFTFERLAERRFFGRRRAGESP